MTKRGVFIFITLVTCFVRGFGQEYVPDINTVLLLHMNELGGSTVSDASGNGNNGTATGTTIVDGKFGKARSFAATGDRIDVCRSNLRQLVFTAEAWIYMYNLLGTPQKIMSNFRPGVDKGYALTVESGKIVFTVGQGVGSQNTINLQSYRVLHDSTWYHIAGVFDGAQVKIFINGLLDINASWDKLDYEDDQTLPFRIGLHNDNYPNYFFNGIIDEVRISSVARSFEEPPNPPAPETILFESNRGGLSAIWRINPDGTSLQRVSPLNITLHEGTPAPSPDGRFIAFYRFDAGLWKMRFDGSEPTLVAGNGGASSGTTWSPFGTEILYQNVSTCSEAVYGISPDGTGQRLVVQPGVNIAEGTAQFPSWSTTNKISVIGRNCGSPTGRLYILNPDRGGIQMILDNAVTASWSPGGTKLAVTRYDFANASYHVWIVNADGSGSVRLTTTDDNGYPNWSPDGTRIVFRRGPIGSPNGNIWVMNSNGSNAVQLTSGSFSEQKPVWIQLTPPTATGNILGTVNALTGGLAGVTVKLLDGNGFPVPGIDPTLTDAQGGYEFTNINAGDYQVMIVEPLGYAADQNPKSTSLSAGVTNTVDFTLTQVAISNDSRSKGYWKHQFDVYVIHRGNAQEAQTQLYDYLARVRSNYSIHFTIFDRDTTFSDWQTVLTVSRSATMLVRAKEQLAALVLNLVSLKIGQFAIVTTDNRTAADALTYVSTLCTDGDNTNDELAKNIAEMVNAQQPVAAGIIPASTILYKGREHQISWNFDAPKEFALYQNYPNPFNPSTTIRYALAERAFVSLTVYNMLGQQVARLVGREQDAGRYRLEWTPEGVASGTYIYRLQVGEYVEVKKLLILK